MCLGVSFSSSQSVRITHTVLVPCSLKTPSASIPEGDTSTQAVMAAVACAGGNGAHSYLKAASET